MTDLSQLTFTVRYALDYWRFSETDDLQGSRLILRKSASLTWSFPSLRSTPDL